MAKLKNGSTATVYHKGTDSYYEAVINRHMPLSELIGESKASNCEDTRSDTAIFKDVVVAYLKMGENMRQLLSVFNDLSKDKKTRRLKLWYCSGYDNKSPTERAQIREAVAAAFRKAGRTVLETGEVRYNMFIRLTA